MNTLEQAAISRQVADYIIDHLLVDRPMDSNELEPTAKKVTADRGDFDAEEIEDITRMAIDYVTRDSKVYVKKVKDASWFYHK